MCSNVEVRGGDDQPYVRIRITDTGCGIEPDALQHVFEPFFTTKPSGERTGLGLATVWGVLTQAGGDARIDSVVGAGTTVELMWPATAMADAADSPPPVVFARRSDTRRVLVVEDDEAMRDATRRVLAQHDYDVLAAASGAEALAVLGSGVVVDLVLTDVIMPKMPGSELARAIRDRWPNTRVVFMSGYPGPLLTDQGALDVGDAVVAKPFSAAQLIAAIAAALGAS